MRNKFTIVIAIALLAILLVYSMTYQVRFDEVAVQTRFGEAGENSIINNSTEDESGIKFKMFYPISAVRKYDKRVQVLEDRPEEQQTSDNIAVVVQSYLAWRVNDPLAFYRALGSFDEAEKQLRSKLRDARKVIGDRFTFHDLTNTDASRIKLVELEEAILSKMQSDLANATQSYGIELVTVGIKRILLAPMTTQEVFNRMTSTRQRMAASFREEGESRAKQIRADADGLKATILSFAQARADQIRGEGEEAAAQYLAVFNQDQDFAIFLRTLEAYKKMFADTLDGKTTLIIDAEKNPLFKLFADPPAATVPVDVAPAASE